MSQSSYVSHFAVLGAYNTRPAGVVRTPLTIPGTLADIRLQPEFGSCGNSALSNGMGNAHMNDGYFNLCNAYPNCGESCTKYVRQLCPGQITNLGGFNPGK